MRYKAHYNMLYIVITGLLLAAKTFFKCHLAVLTPFEIVLTFIPRDI